MDERCGRKGSEQDQAAARPELAKLSLDLVERLHAGAQQRANVELSQHGWVGFGHRDRSGGLQLGQTRLEPQPPEVHQTWRTRRQIRGAIFEVPAQELSMELGDEQLGRAVDVDRARQAAGAELVPQQLGDQRGLARDHQAQGQMQAGPILVAVGGGIEEQQPGRAGIRLGKAEQPLQQAKHLLLGVRVDQEDLLHRLLQGQAHVLHHRLEDRVPAGEVLEEGWLSHADLLRHQACG